MASCPSGVSRIPLNLMSSADLPRGHLIPLSVINEDIKCHCSHYRPLGDTTCHRCLWGVWAVDHYPLDMTLHVIPYQFKSLPIKSISLWFTKKDDVGSHVKGFTEVQINDTCNPCPLSKSLCFWWLLLSQGGQGLIPPIYLLFWFSLLNHLTSSHSNQKKRKKKRQKETNLILLWDNKFNYDCYLNVLEMDFLLFLLFSRKVNFFSMSEP